MSNQREIVISVPLFPPGKQFQVNNSIYTVDHVRIRETHLAVKFKELEQEVDAETIACEPTVWKLCISV